MNNRIEKVFRSRITTAIILLVLLVFIGVIGFRYLNNYTWLDAVYMTVITISTVGFKEVGGSLTIESKIFTIFLILTSVIIVGYAIKVITEYILLKNNSEEIKRKKMQRNINNMDNHIIICGYGRNGRQAAKKLISYKKDFVVIEREKELVDRYKSEMVSFVHGNANDDESLQKAGIERASCLISALPKDSDNVFVVLSARQLNKNIRIISRASQETSYDKLKLAGANNVILPDKIGGDHMASLVVEPDLVEFIDNLGYVGKSHINIEQVPVEKLYDTRTVKSIKALDLRNKTGCNVIGYKSPNGEYIINPEADQELMPESTIIVLGRKEQIELLNSVYNIK